MNHLPRSLWPTRCGIKLFERLLPREKFGNMDHDDGCSGRSVPIC